MKHFLKNIFVLMLIITSSVSYAENIKIDDNKTDISSVKYLDLETAKKIALSDSPSVKAVAERIKQANAQVKQALAAFSPTISLSGSLSRQNAFENSNLPDKEDTYSSDLSVTLNLFNGFYDKANLDYTKLEKNNEIEAVKDARRELIYSVAQSFYNAQSAMENIKIAEEDRAYNLRQLKEAENKKRLGKASTSDVLSFQIEVNSAESSLIDAKNEYRVAMTGLAALLGIENAVFPEKLELTSLKRDEKIFPNTLSKKSLIDEAMKYRPDYKQYEFAVKKADKNIDMAISGFYPSLDLSYTHSASNNDSFNYDSSDYESKTMLSLSFSIFSGGLTKAEVSEAKAKKREAERDLDDAKITISSNITSALLNINSAKEKYELQKKNLKLLKINRDLVENEYKAGKKSLVSLNEAQKNYIEAQSELVQALISLKTYIEKLDSLTGKNLL